MDVQWHGGLIYSCDKNTYKQSKWIDTKPQRYPFQLVNGKYIDKKSLIFCGSFHSYYVHLQISWRWIHSQGIMKWRETPTNWKSWKHFYVFLVLEKKSKKMTWYEWNQMLRWLMQTELALPLFSAQFPYLHRCDFHWMEMEMWVYLCVWSSHIKRAENTITVCGMDQMRMCRRKT